MQFYAAYPRKTNRADAWRAWKALKVNDELFAKIIAGLALWKVHPRWTKDEGQFIKTPGPWLRERLWEDDEVCGRADRMDGRSAPSTSHDEVVL